MYSNAYYVNDPLTNQPLLIHVDLNGVPTMVFVRDDSSDYQNIMALVAAGELIIAPAGGS